MAPADGQLAAAGADAIPIDKHAWWSTYDIHSPRVPSVEHLVRAAAITGAPLRDRRPADRFDPGERRSRPPLLAG
ncbi:MAG: hypothetical protein ACR2NB_08750 [Solirubrobacteraceae bacterium]